MSSLRTAVTVALLASTGAMGALAAPAPRATAPAATTGNRSVGYAPAPEWIAPPPSPSTEPLPPGAPLRVMFIDQQVRVADGGQQTYQAYRVKVLAPEGLAVGNLAMSWAPATEKVTVHRLAIFRDGKVIDVLADARFSVIQRESNLEQATLDGNLTAALQTAGLQVGDELEFAMSKSERDPLLGTRPQGFMQFPIVGARGAYRLRVLLPKQGNIVFRASDDVPRPVVTAVGEEADHRYLMLDPASAIIPDNAPSRYAITRVVQYSGYPTWADVSRTFAPLFVRAAALGAASPVRAEAARIAAETSDPRLRAEAALRVVEDRIRYVYVGLDGGNYRPAAADDTWQRRFGDCKAKTVLLIALLRELGISAEPVLVATENSDGTDLRLPTPGAFNHVVVRAQVNGASYWLDATRLGDRALADLVPPTARWGLPLRSQGAALEAIPVVRPRWPQRIDVIDIDASAGFDKPGRYRVQQTLRGDQIFAMRAQLAGMASADADRLLAGYWRQQLPQVEPNRTTWRLDEANRLLVLGLEGEGKVDWDGDATEGHTHYLYAGGFTPPNELKRPKDQPQNAAWANDYPSYTCNATTIRLPSPGKGFNWSFLSKPVDRTLGGVSYWRVATFSHNVMQMARSRRVDAPEIAATDAAAFNAALADFDNNKSYVFETKGRTSLAAAAASADAVDRVGTFEQFASANPPCSSAKVTNSRE